MTYLQFTKKENITFKLLLKLNILNSDSLIIRINNFPDNDISTYHREIDTDYYFKNTWDFKHHFKYITKINFSEKRVYHSDDIKEVSDDLNISLDSNNIEESLNEIYSLENDNYSNYGTEPYFDEFKLHRLRLNYVDNISKKVNYEGSFYGNNETFEPLDWGLFSLINIVGIPIYISDFYKELIAESYLLQLNGNYKLSYFIAYSALENYINYKFGSEEIEERLKDKLKDLIKIKSPDLTKNKIYTSVIADFDLFTRKRNIIAHGKTEIEITEEELEKALLFTLIIINSDEFNLTTFTELYENL